MSLPREYCPECEPEFVPDRYDTPFRCGSHCNPRRVDGDALCRFESDYSMGPGEAGGSDNIAFCALIHRGKM